MQTCALCRASFEITAEERTFLKKMTFTFGDTVVNPALPTNCPDCRMLFRTCHRNERTFYRRTSSKSGQELIALYSEQPLWGKPFTVYTQEEWRSDAFDSMQYGRAFDFSRPFFEQFSELLNDVPRMNLITVNNENSPYTTGTGYCKNCYLINSSEHCEDCYHGKLLQNCKDCVDCSYLYDSQLCYACFSVYDSYQCDTLLFSKNCQDCYFSSNLTGCKHCLLCTNLHQQEYCVRNQSVSKEEFEQERSRIEGSYSARQQAYQELRALRAQAPQKYANIVSCEHCSGDYIENSRNCTECYDVTDSEDSRYVQVGVNVKDNIDCSNMYLKIERCYQSLGTIEVLNCAYCVFVFHSQDLLYCDYCFHCSECFGCSGLTRKQHCIFNKQYSEEEYEKLVPKIVDHMKKSGEWGDFFPSQYAPFGYNESLAYEYVPLTKKQALERGFLWRDEIDQSPTVEKWIPTERLPDRIEDIPDDVLNWAIACKASRRPFQIIKQELAYYRKHKLPLPRLHPDERHKDRMALRNPRTLWNRECSKCTQAIQTTYAPDRPETVYCEECYLKEVY